MFENKEEAERVVLVAVALPDGVDADQSLDELAALADTAGAVVAGRLIQARDHADPGTYIGKGKIEELKSLIWETKSSGIICDDELTNAQIRNLQEALDVKVMDRTLVILDIFAARAASREGQIQVELAQLEYRQSRLSGRGVDLSKLGGGIGTRGPGETKLETDRRVIRERIAQLNKELADVRRHREETRKNRKKSALPVGAIVGYTNAGKSTLLNALTDADMLAEDRLFATLDPTTRSFVLPDGQKMLLTDTVGFIRKLPHHLIEAFKSTLEEAKYADLILHVVDASSPQMEEQMHTVYETLDGLGVKDKPVITVFNKQDLLEEVLDQAPGPDAEASAEPPDAWESAGSPVIRDFRADLTVRVSAKTGEGLPELAWAIETLLRQQKTYLEQVFDYRDAAKLQLIRKYGELLEETYRDDGIFVRAYVPKELAQAESLG